MTNKRCPFCGGVGFNTIMGPDNELKCGNKDCPIYNVIMHEDKWSTRPSPWISIEDGLPEEHVDVLVMFNVQEEPTVAQMRCQFQSYQRSKTNGYSNKRKTNKFQR